MQTFYASCMSFNIVPTHARFFVMEKGQYVCGYILAWEFSFRSHSDCSMAEHAFNYTACLCKILVFISLHSCIKEYITTC